VYGHKGALKESYSYRDKYKCIVRLKCFSDFGKTFLLERKRSQGGRKSTWLVLMVFGRTVKASSPVFISSVPSVTAWRITLVLQTDKCSGYGGQVRHRISHEMRACRSSKSGSICKQGEPVKKMADSTHCVIGFESPFIHGQM
jgi:hypothetical protein